MSSMVKTVNGDLFIEGCPRCGYDKVQYSDEQWVLDFHCDEEVEFCPSCGLALSDMVFHLAKTQDVPEEPKSPFDLFETTMGNWILTPRTQNDWLIRYNKYCGETMNIPAFSHD